MSFKYPTQLLEFVLSGLVAGSPFLILYLDKFPLSGDLSQSTLLALVVLGFAYLFGIAINGFTLRVAERALSESTNNEVVRANFRALTRRRRRIESLGGILAQTADDIQGRQGLELMEHLSPYVNEHSTWAREEILYLRRLHRMARSGIIGIALWLLFLVYVPFDRNYVVFDVLRNNWGLTVILILGCLFVLAGLFLGLRNHTRLLAQRTLNTFLSLR